MNKEERKLKQWRMQNLYLGLDGAELIAWEIAKLREAIRELMRYFQNKNMKEVRHKNPFEKNQLQNPFEKGLHSNPFK